MRTKKQKERVCYERESLLEKETINMEEEEEVSGIVVLCMTVII